MSAAATQDQTGDVANAAPPADAGDAPQGRDDGSLTTGRANALGKICWLWMNSSLHRGWPVGIQARMLLPPVELGQFLLLNGPTTPLAYCSWAFLDEEREAKYIADPNSLTLEDWRSGDRLWFMDFVSPFGLRITWRLKTALDRKFPDRMAHALRVRPGDDMATVATFAGDSLEFVNRKAARRKDALDLLSHLRDREIARLKDAGVTGG